MPKSQEIIFILVLLLISLFISKIITSHPNVLILGIIISIIVLFISFFNPQIGLAFLVFSMLLSPEIKVGGVPGRDVVVRIDDLLIFAIFLGWFGNSVFTKKLEIIITESLLPIFLYTLSTIVSTYFGIISGHVLFSKSIFYLLKYVEYFIIYFLVTQIVNNIKQVKLYITLFLITSVIVNLHGYSLIGKVDRLYAPFDAPEAELTVGVPASSGEANTYGGYLIIIMSLLLSLFCFSESMTKNFLYLGLLIFSLVPFAYTKSRSSYLAFLPMVLTIVLLTEKKRNLIIGGVLLLFAVSPIVFPEATKTVVERIQETFAGPTYSEEEAVILGFKVKELSALARVKSWKKAFTEFIPNRPLLGYGVTGVGLVDTQIPLIIGEVGLVGLTFFLWLIFSIFKTAYITFKTVVDPLYKSVSLSVVSSLVALLVQSIGANTFIIVRIMEPFWFLYGLVAICKDRDDERI